jgi:glycerol-3-phosphate dehydrogenase
MAEDVINFAIKKNKWEERDCMTRDLRLYGTDRPILPAEAFDLTHEELRNAVQRSVTEEMCLTVEDFLARRTRSLLLDARKAMQQAPVIAELMRAELKKDDDWVQQQIHSFNLIANNYLPTPN